MPGTETAEVDAGGVAATWFAVGAPPTDDGTSPVVLHFHGGGYVMASPATHVGLCSRLARRAAAGSSASTTAWPRRIRSPPRPTTPSPPTGGCSTRASLRAASSWPATRPAAVWPSGLLVRARDAGLALPAGAALMSPWVDLTGSGDSVLANAAIDPILSPELLAHWATLYAGDALADPAASPLFADLSGLPPMVVQLGAREILYDDGLRLVERLLAANGEATFAVWDEMTHWWQLFAGLVPECRPGARRAGDLRPPGHARRLTPPVGTRPR